MESPAIVHPKLIKIGDYTFQVEARCAMTDEQALKVALHYYRTHRILKKDKGKVLQIRVLFDASSINRI